VERSAVQLQAARSHGGGEPGEVALVAAWNEK